MSRYLCPQLSSPAAVTNPAGPDSVLAPKPRSGVCRREVYEVKIENSCVWCLGGCWRLLSEAFLLQFWEWMTDYEALLEKKRVGTGFWSAEEKKTNASCLVKFHAVKFLFHTMICLPNIYSFIPHIFVEYLLCIGVVVEKTQWLLIYTRFCLQIITKEWRVWQERRNSVLTEAQAKGI